MCWKFLQNPQQDLALQVLQPWFGCFDEPDGPEPFRENAVMVVLESRLALLVAQGFQVGEPLQLGRGQSQPRGEVPCSFNCRNVSGPVAGQHELALSREVCDKEFVGVFRPGSPQPCIFPQKLRDLVMTRPRPGSEFP